MESVELRLDRLREAFLDAFLMLSRGYPRKQVLEMVYARYELNKWERLAVYHCSHPYETIVKVRRSTVCLEGGSYVVDGYNVAVSLACMERRVPLFLCPDGFVRDVMGGWKPGPEEASRLLLEYVEALREDLGVERVLVVLDSRVSRSGELASMLRRSGVLAATSRFADKTVLLLAERRGYTPVTSDIVVLERVGGCNHLTHYAIARGAKLVNVAWLLGDALKEFLAGLDIPGWRQGCC